jgi:hypothetical protein
MAVQREQKVSAANYNTLQNRVSRVLGAGVEQNGYGQDLASAPVAAESTIFARHMTELLQDINAISIHQTGSATNLAVLTRGNTILADELEFEDFTGFNQFTSVVDVLEANAGLVDGTQVTLETLASDTRFNPWSGKLIHSFTLTFNSPDHRRAFFNAGGKIYINAQIEGDTSAKADDWRTMLVNMGTIRFASNSTSKTGTGGTVLPLPEDGGPVGNFQLTPSLQIIFEREGQQLNYAENRYRIFVKETSNKAIQFQINFEDADEGDPNFDEEIDGTLVSIVRLLRPTGSAVTIEAPSYSVQSALEVGG